MTLKNLQQVNAELQRVKILDAATARILQGDNGVLQQLQTLNTGVGSLLLAQSNSLPFPTANLLWNGELGHSVYTWTEISGTPSGDKNAECAWWYSHNQPFLAQTFIDSDVDTGANTIAIDASEMTTGATCDLLKTGGSLPSPLAVSTTYFIIKVSDTSIKLATTVSNAESATAIDITTTGTAAETFTVQQKLIEASSGLPSSTAVNNELKTIAHTTFNPRYSKWDSTNGQGDMTGTTSIDALMPTNNIDATTPLARVSLIAARLNQYIEIPTASSMVAGIWDNTSGQREFLTGDIGFNVQVIGTPGTTQRKFKALLTSDRGFQILSDEIVITNSRPDGSLSSTDFIQMSWKQQAGQLQVDIYEYYTPDAQYRLIAQVSSSTSFIYEGGYIEVVSGYPTATSTVRNATYPTVTADMSDLAINGISPTWDTVNFPIGVPSNYNKGNTTNRQWVRLWNTVAANIFISSGVITDGSDVITIPDGAINTAAFASGGYESGSASLYVNLVVEIYDADDVLLLTSSILDPLSNISIQLNDNAPATSNGKIRIVGAGFHGILIDKVHLGYQQNTTYAPNALDNRVLQPIAAPAESSQGGGTGGGGGGGGIIPCVVGRTPIEQFDGEWKQIARCNEGEMWADVGSEPNLLTKLKVSQRVEKVRRVRSANGCEVVCTDGESFMTDRTDYRGTFLFRLRVGDPVLTKIDGRVVQSKIAEISAYIGEEIVYTPSLSNSKLFIAGEWKPGWWQRLVTRFRTGRKVRGGLVLHNQKPIDPNEV